MRELNTEEIVMVSGAGVLADAGKSIGEGIGKLVNSAARWVNSNKDYTNGFKLLGQGIGQLLELNLITGSTTIRKGLDCIFNSCLATIPPMPLPPIIELD